MGLTGEPSSSSDHHQDWGMGIFFIFFPEDHTDPNSATARKKTQPPLIGSFKRINSTHLLSTAQSTISICALLVFITLLFFTLSTFDSSSSSPSSSGRLIQYSSRRQLRNVHNNGNLLKQQQKKAKRFLAPAHALQGMGSLYRRGSKSMSDLVVVHVVESLNLHELKLFLRLFFGSALNSRADLLFLFPAKSVAFDNVILDESDLFFKMVAGVNNASRNSSVPLFLKRSKSDKAAGEPIWGGKSRANLSAGGNQTESIRMTYGSVAGFDVDELDPENSLSGFMDHVPMNMRRWACYPMLLGRLRRNFKYIMLVDVKEWVIVGDGMGRVRTGSPETVHLSTVPQAVPARHGKKGSEKAQPGHAKSVSPAVIRGGARGIRRVSQAMLNEIVRATVAKKKKSTVTESGVFNQLVGNEFLLKNVKLITSTESVPELSSLGVGSYSKNVTVARRGNSNFSVNSSALKDILCPSPLHNSVYSSCL